MLGYLIEITSDNSYLYNLNLLDCIGIVASICSFAYILYMFLFFILKLELKSVKAAVASLISYLIVFKIFSLFMYGISFNNPFIIKNIIVFIILSLITPYLEYWTFKIVNK